MAAVNREALVSLGEREIINIAKVLSGLGISPKGE